MKIKFFMKKFFTRLKTSNTTASISSAEEGVFDDNKSLNDSSVSEEEYSDFEDNDEEEGKQSKEDEDVAMFLSLADKMSVGSMLFILQNHARAMHGIPPCCATTETRLQQQVLVLPTGTKTTTNSSSIPKHHKKCRFAEICGGREVRTVVHEIPNVPEEEKNNIWYSDKEIKSMKSSARKLVVRYLQHFPEYGTSIRILVDSYRYTKNNTREEEVDEEMYSKQRLVEENEKLLMKHQDFHGSSVRGLEPNLCPVLYECRTQSIQCVLREQKRQRYQRLVKNRMRKQKQQQLLNPDESFSSSYGGGDVSKQQQQQKQLFNPDDSFSSSYGGCGDVSSSDFSISSSAMSSSNTDISYVMQGDTTSAYDEKSWNRIRDCYRGVTIPCQTYALKIAECDQVEALKASLSRWLIAV